MASKVGRPTKYSQELVDKICEQIALGYSLRAVTKDESIPPMGTIMRWLAERDETGSYKYPAFREQYARACEERTEAMAEDILDIADDGASDYMEIERKDGTTTEVLNKEAVQRSRLRVDTRKWLMAKMKPKKYGDHLDIKQKSEITHKFEDMTDEQLEAAIKARENRTA